MLKMKRNWLQMKWSVIHSRHTSNYVVRMRRLYCVLTELTSCFIHTYPMILAVFKTNQYANLKFNIRKKIFCSSKWIQKIKHFIIKVNFSVIHNKKKLVGMDSIDVRILSYWYSHRRREFKYKNICAIRFFSSSTVFPFLFRSTKRTQL